MSQEKKHPPSPARLRRARAEGKIAKSQALSGALTPAALALAVGAGLPWAGRALSALCRELFSGTLRADEALSLSVELGLLLALAPALLAALLGTSLGLLQTGWVFSPRALRPDLARISPTQGLKRLFSLQRLGVLPQAAAVTAGAALIFVTALLPLASSLPTLLLAEPLRGAAQVLELFEGLLLAGGGLALGAGAVEYLLARRANGRALRMTDQEARDDHKSQEGDPQHKSQRKQAHKEMALAPARPLREARALLVNPTHLAVALHHEPDGGPPVVGARGRDAAAAQLRAEASALGIPILRDRPLARALIRLDPGAEIPAHLYEPVALVLASIYRASRPKELSQ